MSNPKSEKEKSRPDPTQDPDFKKVVKHFLTSPPKPHNQEKRGKTKNKNEDHRR
jgi:hypothetical protein